MKSRPKSRSLSLAIGGLALLLAPGSETRAQTPSTAALQALVLATGQSFVGAGAAVTWALGPRLEIEASGNAGRRAGRTMLRLEGAAVFHLNFATERGWGLYGGGGVAVHSDDREAQFLLLKLGFERRNRRGPYFEVGVGGGLRVAAGVRTGW